MLVIARVVEAVAILTDDDVAHAERRGLDEQAMSEEEAREATVDFEHAALGSHATAGHEGERHETKPERRVRKRPEIAKRAHGVMHHGLLPW